MTVSMPELRRLLAEATERPWSYKRVEGDPHEDILIWRLSWEQNAADLELIVAAVGALPALLAAVEALEARHEFECGCDSPGDLTICVGDPIDEYKPLAAFSFGEQA